VQWRCSEAFNEMHNAFRLWRFLHNKLPANTSLHTDYSVEVGQLALDKAKAQANYVVCAKRTLENPGFLKDIAVTMEGLTDIQNWFTLSDPVQKLLG
jgi:hypothetical protein